MVADGQIEFTDETACAESGKRVSQGDELLLQRGRRFAGLPMRGAGDFQQAAGTLLLIAAEPLANRGHGGGEQPRGGLDAALAGRFDQAKAMVISVFHLTYQIEVTSGSGHGAGSLLLARRPALPPAGRLSPSASSGSHTSIPLGGYDVSRLFQFKAVICRFPRIRYTYRLNSGVVYSPAVQQPISHESVGEWDQCNPGPPQRFARPARG